MSKLIPLPGFVLVQPIKEEEKTASGLYMPESAQDKPMKGKVIACGPEIVNYLPTSTVTLCPVRVDQTVIYKKWVNQEVKSDGKDYLLIEFKDLLAIEE